MQARERLIDELRSHALVLGEVVLTSGQVAQYYVDAKRAILRPAGFAALSELVAARASEWRGDAAGGPREGGGAPRGAAPPAGGGGRTPRRAPPSPGARASRPSSFARRPSSTGCSGASRARSSIPTIAA